MTPDLLFFIGRMERSEKRPSINKRDDRREARLLVDDDDRVLLDKILDISFTARRHCQWTTNDACLQGTDGLLQP